GGTTNATIANVYVRLPVLDGSRKDLDRILLGQLLLDYVERGIEHVLCDTLLAAVHQAIDELRREERFELRIGPKRGRTSGDFAHGLFTASETPAPLKTSWHHSGC